MDFKELERRYKYHAPDDQTRVLHDDVRDMEMNYAMNMDRVVPGDSREKALMHTHLEQAAFYAHAHIARNIGGGD